MPSPQSSAAKAMSPAMASHAALASMLRRSSRLIHTLQKERGASCALCAAVCSNALMNETAPGATSERIVGNGGLPMPTATDSSTSTGHHQQTSPPASHDVDLRSFHAHQWDRSDSYVGLDAAGQEHAPAAAAESPKHHANPCTSAIPEQLYDNVQQSRRDVDVALKAFLVATSTSSITPTFPLEKSLASIRRAVNAFAGIVSQTGNENDATGDDEKNVEARVGNNESGIGAALRHANLTPPIEEPVEDISGIGAVLRAAAEKGTSFIRSPSMEFGGGDESGGGNNEQKSKVPKAGPSNEKVVGGAGGFHPILSMFNSCISTLIRTYVLEKCHDEMERLGPVAGEQGQERPHLHRVSSLASIGVGTGGNQLQPSVGRGGTKYSSSPRGESNRMGTLSGNHPSDFPRLSPSRTALSSSMRKYLYPEPSLRELRTVVGSGGVPSSDPSLYAFVGSVPHHLPAPTSPMPSKTLVAPDIFGHALLLPPLPSVTAAQKNTRWGSRGGFDLPTPTYVGSYDPMAMSMATNNNPMIRTDSQATFGSANSGSIHNGQHLIRTFAPPSTKSLLASKSISLLSILISFTELKESMGIERALLASLLPQSSQGQPFTDPMIERKPSERKSAPQILFSDLVLEEENQRKIIRRLRSAARAGRHADAASVFDVDGVPHGDGDVNFHSLLLLVEDSARLTPEMERIQDLIRRDFNIDAFRDELSMGDFWHLITIYMDRLHATELLIIEELECCLSNPASVENDYARSDVDLSGQLSAQGLEFVLGRILLDQGMEPIDGLDGLPRKEFDIEALVDKLQNMSPEKVKEKLLVSLSLSANRPKQGNESNESEHSEGNSIQFGQKRTENATGDSADIISPETYTPTDWDIDCYEIEFKKRIGRGVAGTTYLAHWSGQPVAVKVAAITDLGVQGWKTECESLRQLHHPNVVRLLGSIYNPNPRTFGLVLEYCEAGDLKSALSRWTPKDFFWKVAGDIANGMSYLHRKGIIHRDM